MLADRQIHLDHAATSWPKAPGVVDAVRHWFEALGVDAARGDGHRCEAVAGAVARARANLARSCGVPTERVAFTSGATEALNLFFQAFLRPGDRVVTTATEHSSVVRPLVAMRETHGIRLDVIPCDGHGRVDPNDVRRSIAEDRTTRLLALCHASNVTGTIQDAPAIVSNARDAGVPVLLDASQTAGVTDLALGADAVVASAHKGLLGPPGVGFLAAAPELDLSPVKHGGTGSASSLERHPRDWPRAFEAGTPNSPGIFGLGAALDWLDRRGDPEPFRESSVAAVDALREALADRLGSRITFQSPIGDGARLPVLSFTLAGMDPAEAGLVLADAGVTVRTGFHCAPWIHSALGTNRSGSVRVSPGPFVSVDELMLVADVLAR